MKLTELINKAKGYDHVYVTGHIHPDGDCVGATIGMAQLLENAGVASKVLLMEKPDMFAFLPMDNYVQTEVPEDVDLLISLDASDLERLGDFADLVSKVDTINIDHHISNTNFGDINFVNDEASSTCEMVFNMIDDMELMNREIAEALYTGIIYDTGAFKHTNTGPSTHIAAAELIRYGIDYNWITTRLFYEKPFKAYKAQSVAYDRLVLKCGDMVAVSWMNHEDFERMAINKSHVDSIVQHMNDIQDTEVAAFFYAIDQETYKVSLRSKGKVNVNQVAGSFGGGGHIKASGASLKGDIDTCIDKVMAEIEKQL